MEMLHLFLALATMFNAVQFMAAMLEEQNNKIYLHKNKTFFPVETNSIVFSSSMAAVNTLYIALQSCIIPREARLRNVLEFIVQGFVNLSPRDRLGLPIHIFIIQQIVTMPIYGKEALDICHPYVTDILR